MTCNTIRSITILLSTLILAAGSSACLEKSDDAVEKLSLSQLFSVSGNGFDTFRSTVFQYTKKYCSECHRTGGEAPQDVRVADNIAEIAYLESAPKTNFTNPALSTLVSKTTDGHCTNCNSDGQEMISLIAEWAIAELAVDEGDGTPGGPGGGGDDAPTIFTDAITIPVDIPSEQESPGSFATISWDLETISADFASSSIEMKIQEFSNAYRVKEPTLINGESQTIQIEFIGILINGIYFPQYSNYHTVSAGVAAADFGVLSTSLMIMGQGSGGPGSDSLQLGFKTLSLSP